jgi:hypothetical protein
MFSSYLIGLHMTIDFWRPNRDQDGWRCSTAYIQGIKDCGEWLLDYDRGKVPLTVKAVPCLMHDISALEELTFGDVPLLRQVWGRKTGPALYGLGMPPKQPLGQPSKLKINFITRTVSGLLRLWKAKLPTGGSCPT